LHTRWPDGHTPGFFLLSVFLSRQAVGDINRYDEGSIIMSPTTQDAPVGRQAGGAGQAAQAALRGLAGEMAKRGFQADLKVPHETLPYLIVRNPSAAVLTETLYAEDGAYWWSWWDRIAGWEDPATAAGIVARVLRTADGR
jgi:hypothetical protein